jgi:hypothetical protein
VIGKSHSCTSSISIIIIFILLRFGHYYFHHNDLLDPLETCVSFADSVYEGVKHSFFFEGRKIKPSFHLVKTFFLVFVSNIGASQSVTLVWDKFHVPLDLLRYMAEFLYEELTWMRDNVFRYGHISYWDTSRRTNMDRLFYRLRSFNRDLSNWNVSVQCERYGGHVSWSLFL